MDDVKLLGMLLTAVSPILGLVVWVVKKGGGKLFEGMDNINTGLSNINSTMQHQIQDAAVREERENSRWQRLNDTLEKNVCPLGPVDADLVVRGAKDQLRRQPGT